MLYTIKVNNIGNQVEFVDGVQSFVFCSPPAAEP